MATTDTHHDLATARDLLATWRQHGTVPPEVLDWFDWLVAEVKAWQDAVADLAGMAFANAHGQTELAVLLQTLAADHPPRRAEARTER